MYDVLSYVSQDVRIVSQSLQVCNQVLYLMSPNADAANEIFVADVSVKNLD